MLRIWLLFFGGGVGSELLFYGGMATLAFGIIGMLASQELGRLAGYSLLVSSGTLLAAISRSDGAVTGAALFYLVASTLGIAAFFLLIELVQRAREPGADVLAVTAEAFGLGDEDEQEPEEQSGTEIPAVMALLGLSFVCCALLVAGLAAARRDSWRSSACSPRCSSRTRSPRARGRCSRCSRSPGLPP